MRTLFSLRLHKCLVQMGRQIDLVIKSCHLLFIVKQLLLADLLHVTVSVVQPLDLGLRLLKSHCLCHQVRLQFFILLDYPCCVQLVFPLNLVNLNVLKRLQFNFLLIKPGDCLSFGAITIQNVHLTLFVLILQVIVKRLDIFVEPIDVPFKLLNQELELVLLSLLSFFLPDQPPLSIFEVPFSSTHILNHPLPFFSIPVLLLFIVLPLLFDSIVSLFQVLFEFLLGRVELFVQFLQLSIFSFIRSGQLGDLLGHKANIVLILRTLALFLHLNLMETCMQVLQLSSINVSRLFNSVQKISDSLLSFFDFILKLMQVSVVVFSFFFSLPFLFPQKAFNLTLVTSQGLYGLTIPFFKLSEVSSMNFHQLLPQMIQLLFTFSLQLIELILKPSNLSQQLLTVVTMPIGLTLDLLKQFSDLFILDRNDLLESIQLNTEYLALILKVLLDVLELKVYHLLELLFKPADLVILFFNRLCSLLLFVLNHFSEPRNFFILLFPNLFDSASYYLLNCLFFMKSLFQLSNFESILLLPIFEIFLGKKSLSLDSILTSRPLFSYL